ncbi:MAG TPA: hypothetical protein DEA64_02960 [Pseudothermotoga sp.]|nr:hypothetical protein [Pseudothermotoga sp.]
MRKNRRFYEKRLKKLMSLKGKIDPRSWFRAKIVINFILSSFDTEKVLKEFLNKTPSTSKEEISQFGALSDMLELFTKITSLFIVVSALTNLQADSVINYYLHRISRLVNKYNKTHRFKLFFSESLVKQKALRDGLAILLRTLQEEEDSEWIGEVIKTKSIESLRALPSLKRAKLLEELLKSIPELLIL